MKSQVLQTVLVLALFTAIPSPTPAVDLSGQSRSYLQSREASDASRLLPFFEYLDFRAGDLGAKNTSFHFGGWLRYDLRDDSMPGTDRNSDLQYAYLSIRGGRADAILNLGRVRVQEGVAMELVDGAAAGADLRGGFRIAAFGGSPVETSFDERRGDSVYGGRISHGLGSLYRVGFSYLKEQNRSEDYREEEGIDLWFRPFSKLELFGDSFYNDLTSEWMRHEYSLALGPFGPVSLRTVYSRILYKDYFFGATTSAFRLDPAVIDPQEEMNSIGQEAAFTAGAVTASADYRKYSYEIAGDATYYGGKLAYSSSLKGGLGAAYHRMDGAIERLRYGEYRVYGFTSFGRFNVTADYLLVRYDQAINNVKNASTAVLAAGYAVTARAKIGADIEYAENPYYDKDVRGLVKFIYNFAIIPAKSGRK